jgi:hypothetical protein
VQPTAQWVQTDLITSILPLAAVAAEAAVVEDAGGYRETEHVKKYLASARF